MLRNILFLLFCFPVFAIGQSNPQLAAIDSMKTELSKARTGAEKVYLMDLISRTQMNVNLEESEKTGQDLIRFAEESRDRSLMIEAYLSNGTRCSYFAGSKDYTSRSIAYFTKALDIAKQSRLDPAIVKAQLKLAAIHLTIPEKEAALNYTNQAFSIVSALKNDSLRIATYNSFGLTYLSLNDKILALRNFLTALRLAEEIRHAALIRDCNLYLATFYSNIEDFDRAIDYQTTAFKQLNEMKEKNVPYMRVIDVNSIGMLYARKKNFDMAISYFERSLAMADSLKFPTLKIPAYVSLLNQYLRMHKPDTALAYFNSASGQELRQFLSNFGFSSVIDQAFGVIYTDLNKFDSARYYFQRAAPYFEKGSNENSKMNFYFQLGNLVKKTGEYDSAIAIFLKAKAIAEKAGDLESSEAVAKQLDSLYLQTGDFREASRYNSVYYLYKDSIAKINKEKELTQVEAADEQLRVERIEKEKQEAKRKRFNIQYMGITIGITALFVALVMLGMFKVSAGTIKMIGFFAFLMFFEFIFLIFKKNIYSLTEGEPWKDLLFMIALAAMLLPLHHWLEHKVIHYLTSHNRLTQAGTQLKTRLFNRKKPGNH